MSSLSGDYGDGVSRVSEYRTPALPSPRNEASRDKVIDDWLVRRGYRRLSDGHATVMSKSNPLAQE